jgi:Nif-specific regulatory protein
MDDVSRLELKVLYEIARIIGQSLDLDQTLGDILRIFSDTLSMKRATVVLLDEETGLLTIRASHGLRAEERARGVYGITEGVTGRIFQSGQPMVVPDVAREPLFLDRTGARRLEGGRVSFIGVPILIAGQPVGVLSVDRLFGDEVSFEEDVRFLSIASALISQFVQLGRQAREREENLRRENLSLRFKLSRSYQRYFLVGQSPPMARVRQLIEKVAPTRATVLISGEPGSGKTLTARMIHELSDRARHPFIKVACRAIPPESLEAELFGREPVAGGGDVNVSGRVEEAEKGTLFLDGVGGLSPGVQAKLLRLLCEREFERVGSAKSRRADVRVIAGTVGDLEEAARAGLMREDLFYRLNVFPIQVPPLKRRREDIPALINHFLDRLAREYGRRLSLSPRALDALVRHDWPGNVREMENLVERLSVMVEGERIDLGDIPGQVFAAGSRARAEEGASGQGSLKDMERREVLAALERHGWVQSRAARELGLTLRQMGYRIRKFGLERAPEAAGAGAGEEEAKPAQESAAS